MTYRPIILTTPSGDVQFAQCDDCGAIIANIPKHDETHRCCAGGPQWGHAWDCPKCPD